MAKGQVRSNREAKKPKQDKPKKGASYLGGGTSGQGLAAPKPTAGKK